MNLFVTLISCAVFLNVVKSYVLPIEKCRFEDSNCLVAGFQKGVPIFFSGIPELGVEKVGPIDDVHIELSGLKFVSKNGMVKGLENIVIDKVTWNTKRRQVKPKYHTDCSITGNYTAGGKILILPIEGDGQYKIKLKNMIVETRINYEVVTLADGKDHLRLLNYTYQFDVKDGAEFHLTNLFRGNKDLSDAALKFVNDNWKIISQEFGRNIVDKVAEKIFKNVNILFKKLPLKDIAIV